MDPSRPPSRDQGDTVADHWHGRPRQQWVDEYAASHQHPFNQRCHLLGIPMITASMPAALLILVWPNWWPVPVSLFVLGWLLQFCGHFVEGKPPEFFRDWRFLMVGFRWWLQKIGLRRRIEGPPQS